MKRLIYVMMLLICISVAIADTIEYDTPVTLDWVGNNEFYIRTEDFDKKFNCNLTDDYQMNLTLNVPFNDTDINQSKIILSGIQNMTQRCSIMEDQFNCSDELMARVAAHERVVVYYDGCKKEKEYFESGYVNTSKELDKCDAEKELVLQEKNTLVKNYDDCTTELEEESKKAGENQTYIILGLVGGAVAGYWFCDSQKKKKMPGPMANAGHPGYQVQKDKPKW